MFKARLNIDDLGLDGALTAAVLLYLMVHGPGKLSLDHWIARRYQAS